jgi:elongation factor P
MAMLEYNEILLRKFIIIDGAPYEVLDAHIFRMQQRKPQNKTKLKNLITGSVMEMTFHASDKVEEAEIGKREIKFLYTNKGESWFCETNDPSKRFQLKESVLGTAAKYMKPNSMVEILTFEDDNEEERIIGVKTPVKVDLAVVEAPPGIKGDSARGGGKVVKLETGAEITAPLFINVGDIVKINTETDEYVERVNK